MKILRFVHVTTFDKEPPLLLAYYAIKVINGLLNVVATAVAPAFVVEVIYKPLFKFIVIFIIESTEKYLSFSLNI